jgi:hypothetical protein
MDRVLSQFNPADIDNLIGTLLVLVHSYFNLGGG